ncbi:hypothetical protein O6H91_01G151000 [Diphasiastrum complanatum]|uniref:Uncharacterized protein n=1 Tax=Diphasiastrum complanatum TaxID=34168 RepID=A0ACC2EXC4_DIPCM|nr:hypothetical protein O6H91_01G151000 [Diphasiastrum complanatum]
MLSTLLPVTRQEFLANNTLTYSNAACDFSYVCDHPKPTTTTASAGSHVSDAPAVTERRRRGWQSARTMRRPNQETELVMKVLLKQAAAERRRGDGNLRER